MTSGRLSRPYVFLVSTPGGKAADDVFDALAPAIERLGSWRKIPHPESSLAHAAAQAEASGGRPIHLAIGQVQGVYLTPALPTVLLPLWDYPDIPTTDLHRNGRMNWARVAGRADLILAPSTFTADAFRKAGVLTPIEVFPIPPRRGWSELATWGPELPMTLNVPHADWSRIREEESIQVIEEHIPDLDEISPSWSQRLIKRGRTRLRRLKPYLSNATIQKLDGYKRQVIPIIRRPHPIRLLGGIARAGYRRFVGRWVSDEAHTKLRGLRNRLRGRHPVLDVSPTSENIAARPLTLSGLVYSAVVDYSDPTINDVDLISAALHAFHDRPDVTLLLRLISTPEREAVDLDRLARACATPRLDHLCRIVVVTGSLSDNDVIALGRATSFVVETSRTRGWSLRLTEALASGCPVIAPTHSVFADWINEEVGLPLQSHPEPTVWPLDAEGRHATSWNRVVWSDLRDRLIESVKIADCHPRVYECLSASARQEVAERVGPEVVVETLRSALKKLTARPVGAFSWD